MYNMRFKLPRKRSAQVLLASGVALAGFAGLTFAQVPVAMADPTVTLVAAGSDTIQDVYNQFSLDFSGNLVGSYDAVNPVTQAAGEIITPRDGTAGVSCSFIRPNGSGGGLNALRASIDPNSANDGGISGTAKPQQGCVDIARSSKNVTQDGRQSNTGPLVFIPFAIDAVAGSTGAATTPDPSTDYNYTYTGATDNTQHTVAVTPAATLITHADDFSVVDLINLYDKCLPVTVDGVTYDPTGATGTKIDLYIPQSGSGTAQFWASTLGNFSLSSLPSCVHQVIVGGPLATAPGGVPVEEHNGTPMASDPNGFGPFSAAQWIAQRSGHNERRHTAVIHTLKGCTGINSTVTPATGTCNATPTSPFSNGNPTTGTLNTAFPITREVFSVVSDARVTTASDPLFSLLNGGSSLVCSDAISILNYGFAIDPNCGQVVAANRSLG